MVLQGRKECHIIGVNMWLVYAVIYKEDLIIINKCENMDNKVCDGICKIVATGADLVEAVLKVKEFLTEKVKDVGSSICGFELIKAEKFEKLDGIDYFLIRD